MPTPPEWTLIIPVKQTAIAKSRLTGFAGRVRRQLALAFAYDAVAAALGCPRVSEVIVVTNDDQAGHCLAGLGACVVPDVPDAGLNPALESAVAMVRSVQAVPVVVMSGDLPAARSADIEAALALAPAAARWFVPDLTGDGTTMLGAPPGSDLAAAFGPGSRHAHVLGGAAELGSDLLRLRLDVDTAADLRAAVGLGVGAATSAVLASAGWSDQPPVHRAG